MEQLALFVIKLSWFVVVLYFGLITVFDFGSEEELRITGSENRDSIQ